KKKSTITKEEHQGHQGHHHYAPGRKTCSLILQEPQQPVPDREDQIEGRF
ncbi:unnamed protein product, partial [Amoebophrya sp. A25]